MHALPGTNADPDTDIQHVGVALEHAQRNTDGNDAADPDRVPDGSRMRTERPDHAGRRGLAHDDRR